MARAIWKGAISFGLVHIPVSLSAATSSQGIDFDWLDQRSMEPVGYKRVNKVTGKEIERENIVKGVEYEKGRYVVLSEEEIRAAHPKSTQTIEIFAFVDSQEIPLQHFDTPYYLAPDRRGGKVYALLRETLERTGKVALANVVLHTRQHLALLRPLAAWMAWSWTKASPRRNSTSASWRWPSAWWRTWPLTGSRTNTRTASATRS